MINSYSKILVFVQFASIGAIVITNTHITNIVLFAAILLFGSFIGIWAIISIRLNNFQIFPEPIVNAQLVTTGIYKFVRHPMYTSVLLMMLAFVLQSATIFSSILYLILIINLLAKIKYEEQLLRQTFPDYEEYSQQAWRLLPFIF